MAFSSEGDDRTEHDELQRTAYHEAGHCVMAVLCGAVAQHASIAPEEDNFYGRVDIQWPDRRSLDDELSVILAGPVAEMIYRAEPLHPGLVAEWSLDWQQAWRLGATISRQFFVDGLHLFENITFISQLGRNGDIE